jgi:hypothetical protein
MIERYTKSCSSMFLQNGTSNSKAIETHFVLIKKPRGVDIEWTNSQPSLTARQTVSSSLVAVCSTPDDFASHGPTSHLLGETCGRSLHSYSESVSHRWGKSRVHGSSPCAGLGSVAPRPLCSVYRYINDTRGCGCRYCTIVSVSYSRVLTLAHTSQTTVGRPPIDCVGA